MKHEIYVSNIVDKSYSSWSEDNCFNFDNLQPSPRVLSILQVHGETKWAALSYHYEYLAIINGFQDCETLFIIYLKKKKVEALKSFSSSVTAINFLPDRENLLLVGSECGTLFFIDLESKTVQSLEGHWTPPIKIAKRLQSNILFSWNQSEVLAWSWPLCSLMKRLMVTSDLNYLVVQAGHILEKSLIYVCFNGGTVLLWDQNRNMKEHTIEPPAGVTMEFKSFSHSLDGEWIVGVGADAMIIIYSLTSLRVVQAVHFSHPESALGLCHVEFLPCTHPQYPKTFLLLTMRSIIIVDFVKSSVIKVLKSQNHSITGVCVSGDGFLLGVTYADGSLKLYTLPSFYPKPTSVLTETEQSLKEVQFTVLNVDQRKEKKAYIAELFDNTKWRNILEEFREFPSKYRKHIWTSLLRLPRNFSIYNEILSKTKSKKFNNLQEEFPNESQETLDVLKNTLECLCYWAPFLIQFEAMGRCLLPFVRMFEPNLLLCFEVCLTVIINWWSLWFDNWPSPPRIILKLVDDLVRQNDAHLWSHLNKLDLTARLYAWPLLISSFKQVLVEEDWLVLWDHILSKPPSYMIYALASFTLCLRSTLLKCSTKQDAKQIYSQETWIPIRAILKKADSLQEKTVLDEIIRETLQRKRFMTKGSLPPCDIGAGNSDLVNFSLEIPRLVKLRRRSESKASHDNLPSANLALLDNSNIKKKTSPVEGIDLRHLNVEEENCLRRIHNTRKRLLNQPIL